MRTFLALDLPDTIRQNVAAITSQLQAHNVSGINWVKPENLHITFQFIGDTQRHDLNDISDIIDEVFSGIYLPLFSLPKLEIIPARSPRIIWISLQTAEKRLFAASRKLRSKLQKLGYKIDNKSLSDLRANSVILFFSNPFSV